MRTTFGTASFLALALSACTCARAAETPELSPYMKELRDLAVKEGPAALRELACSRFNGGGHSDVFLVLREASDAGDDRATLALSSLLRYGTSIGPDIDAADRLVMQMVTKIRAGQSTQFPTLEDAARFLYSGRCAHQDIVTAISLSLLDENCEAFEGPKPAWCMQEPPRK